jgi:hypothetical protein
MLHYPSREAEIVSSNPGEKGERITASNLVKKFEIVFRNG